MQSEGAIQVRLNRSELGEFSTLVGSIYDAALNARAWPEVVRNIANFQNTDKALLFTSLHTPSQGGFAFPVGISESAMQEWAERYAPQDLWARAIIERGLATHGSVVLGDDVIEHRELVATDWYKEYLSRIGVARLCAGVVFGLESTGTLPTSMCVYRGAESRRFGQRAKEKHRLLLPHVSRSLGIMFRLRDAELRVAATLAALDRLSSGVILIGSQRKVGYANRAAQRLMAEEDGLRLKVTAQGSTYLSVKSPEIQRQLDAALDQCLDPDVVEVPHFLSAVRIYRPSGRAAYAINVSALPPVNEFGTGPEQPRAIAFLSDPAAPPEVDEAQLQRLYGLTPAECRVAAEVCSGNSLARMSERLCVTENTVKTQLQSIFDKTGTHRQAQLVKLLLSLSSRLP